MRFGEEWGGVNNKKTNGILTSPLSLNMFISSIAGMVDTLSRLSVDTIFLSSELAALCTAFFLRLMPPALGTSPPNLFWIIRSRAAWRAAAFCSTIAVKGVQKRTDSKCRAKILHFTKRVNTTFRGQKKNTYKSHHSHICYSNTPPPHQLPKHRRKTITLTLNPKLLTLQTQTLALTLTLTLTLTHTKRT